MTTGKKLRSIALANNKINCHIKAKEAYDLSKGFKYQIQRKSIIDDFATLFESIDVVHVTQSSSKHFHFFAGWERFDSRCSDKNKKINVIVHTDISEQQIAKLSWLYVFSGLLSDLHRKSNLSQMLEAVESMPNSVRRFLFKDDYSCSAHVIVQRITEETRSAIRNQRQAYTLTSAPTKSILNELLEND